MSQPIEIPTSLDLTSYAVNSKHELNEDNLQDPTCDIHKGLTTRGKYSLSAVVVHEGSLDHGHYYTFVKVPKNPFAESGLADNTTHWVKLNDHMVSKVSEEEVLRIAKGEDRKNQQAKTIYEKYLGTDSISTNAYILFYSQID